MRVGFIGLGTMGFPMCSNLVTPGRTVTVFDLSTARVAEMVAKGAVGAKSCAEVGSQAEVLFLSLPRPEDVESALVGPGGALASMAEGSYIVDLSTNDPATIRRIAKAAKALGVIVLDAPVSGGHLAAAKGALTIMVGGPRKAYLACYPLLTRIGRRIYHVGKVGNGNVVKLVNNYIALANLQTGLEAITVGAKAGIDPEQLVRVVGESTGASAMITALMPGVVFPRKFVPAGFASDLAAKDLRLMVSLAETVGLSAENIKRIKAIYDRASTAGMGQQDIAATAVFYEQEAGVTLAPRRPSQKSAEEEDKLPEPVLVKELEAPARVGPLGKRSIVKPLVTAKHFTLVYSEFPLSKRVEEHTRENDEGLFILSGEQLVEFPDQPSVGSIRLKPGSALMVPAGVRHRHSNVGHETMRMIVVFSPPGRETDLILKAPVVDVQRLD